MSLGPKSNFIPVVYAGTKKKKNKKKKKKKISGYYFNGKKLIVLYETHETF